MIIKNKKNNKQMKPENEHNIKLNNKKTLSDNVFEYCVKNLESTNMIDNNSNLVNLSISTNLVKDSTNIHSTNFLEKQIDINLNKYKVKSERKYNSIYRKKLLSKLENIKDKDKLIDIYYIITNEIDVCFSSNRNGIFININILSDNCIDKIIDYIEKNILHLSFDNNDKSKYNCYKFDDVEILSVIGHKFSNQEKHILKRIKSK